MTHLKHCFNISNSFKKGRSLFLASSLFLLLPSCDAGYLHNDFRDKKDTTHIRGELDLKSDKLPLNTFDDVWDELPSHNEQNSAFGIEYYDIYYNFDNFKVGLFQEETLKLRINSGFVQTWYQAEKNFIHLLKLNNIGNDISYTNLDGNLNYLDSNGLFLQKIMPLYKNNFLSVKLKLYHPKELQYLDVNGYNSSERFKLGFDYYYTGVNYISDNSKKDSFSAIGYGVDLEYIYDDDSWYIYAGILNISTYIDWRSVTLMHYDLDSETKYLGEDGYMHQRAFGVGYYDYDVDFIQKLPIFYEMSIDHSISKDSSIGVNSQACQDIYFNEIYATSSIYKNRYKLGYIIENNIFNFGAYYKYISLEISNDFDLSQTLMKAKYHIEF